jgi:hypothetical protein
LVSPVARYEIFIIVAQLKVYIFTGLTNSWPCIIESRWYIVKNIGVKEPQIKGSNEVREREDGEFFKDRFSMIIVSFVRNDSYSSLLFSNERQEGRG